MSNSWKKVPAKTNIVCYRSAFEVQGLQCRQVLKSTFQPRVGIVIVADDIGAEFLQAVEVALHVYRAW